MNSEISEKVARRREVNVVHKKVSSKNTRSKTKTVIKRKTNLRHKIPSSKLVAACANHKSTHKFKDWQWTPVVNISVNGKTLTALVDSGASHSLMATGQLKIEKSKTKIESKKVQSIWKTCGSSSYLTSSTSKLEFQLSRIYDYSYS